MNEEITAKEDTKEEIEKNIKEKFWDVYASNTSSLSSICRQLAFAEGGICWFYIQNSYIPIGIKVILTFLLMFFISDACQYFSLAANNKKQAEFYEELLHREEPMITTKEQVLRPIKINSSGNIFFGIKLFSIAIASLLLIAKFYYQ